mgnify:CR=1 FL=1
MATALTTVTPTTLRITRIGQAELVVRNAEKVAEFLFRFDPSSVADYSYDVWIARQIDPDRFSTEDVEVMNRTMAARSPYAAWGGLVGRDLPWLSAIDRGSDLFRLGDLDWSVTRGHIEAALKAMVGKHRNLAVVTKMLHMKRPRLIPLCDSYVQQQVLGCVLSQAPPEALASSGMDLIDHLRAQGKRNLDGLLAVQEHLAARGIERTLVRILDLLLWSSYEGARWHMLEPLLAEWFGTEA